MFKDETMESIVELFKNYKSLTGLEFAPINDLIVYEKYNQNICPLNVLYFQSYREVKNSFTQNWFTEKGFNAYYESYCINKAKEENKEICLYPVKANINLIKDAYDTYINHLNKTIDVMEYWGLEKINEYISLNDLYVYVKKSRQELVEFMNENYKEFR